MRFTRSPLARHFLEPVLKRTKESNNFYLSVAEGTGTIARPTGAEVPFHFLDAQSLPLFSRSCPKRSTQLFVSVLLSLSDTTTGYAARSPEENSQKRRHMEFPLGGRLDSCHRRSGPSYKLHRRQEQKPPGVTRRWSFGSYRTATASLCVATPRDVSRRTFTVVSCFQSVFYLTPQ